MTKESTITDAQLDESMTALEGGSSIDVERRLLHTSDKRLMRLLDERHPERFPTWLASRLIKPPPAPKTTKKGRNHITAGFISQMEHTPPRWPIWRHLAKDRHLAQDKKRFSTAELELLQATAVRLFTPVAVN